MTSTISFENDVNVVFGIQFNFTAIVRGPHVSSPCFMLDEA